ncbi:MAG: hypothetical protein CMJ76_03270 [Planctomycetaceae bacterium]|nr:hypothetical protein [Planctomycetaceae bacterium]
MSRPLHIQNLRVTRKDRCICAFDQLTVEQGERIHIQGLNGSGKSTLFRVIAGLEQDYEGQIDIPAELKPVGFVQQNPYLFRGTVLTNLLYGTSGKSIPHADDVAREIADKIEITKLLDRKVKYLSGGERRRVALGRTMILSPALLLLDEPFADMDSPGINATSNYLNSLRDTTILISSPSPLPEMPLLTRVITMD